DPEMLAQVDALQSKIQELESAKAEPASEPDLAQMERIAHIQDQLEQLESVSAKNSELLLLVRKLEERIAHMKSESPAEPDKKPSKSSSRSNSGLLIRLNTLQSRISQLESLPKESFDQGLLDQLAVLQKMITSYKRNLSLAPAQADKLIDLHGRIKKLRAAVRRKAKSRRTDKIPSAA
ncbi:MAG: hypothetical protein J4G04_02865, partial [Nitrosopumilaceae archaeon]|nr:hypothetical protein [Nitrosopumilaceae archaeon]